MWEACLRQAVSQGELRALDLHLALWLGRIAGGVQPERLLAAALASRATAAGDVCLDLAHARRLAPSLMPLYPPSLHEWRTSLRGWAAVGAPGEYAPLVLDDADRLYLGRFWAYEQTVAERLRTLALAWAEVDYERLRAGLARLFPQPAAGTTDWQRVAAAVAVLKRLAVITGGPGTGKTYTVAAVLALLQEQAAATGRIWQCALTAPTGKAAARLSAALGAAKQRLPLSPAAAAALPETAQTIHRLLGTRSTGTRPRYHAGHPLSLDVLVIDEASMIDLPLMAQIVAAVPATARLIMLGDRDQLASVEAGQVLGDICGHGALPYSPRLQQALRAVGVTVPHAAAAAAPALADCLVSLRYSHRFAAHGGIGALARAVHAGDETAAQHVLAHGAPEVSQRLLDETSLRHYLSAEWVPRYRRCVEAATPEAALAAFERVRLLCALRHGPWGAEAINALVIELLAAAGLVRPASHGIYPGRAVMVVANDETIRLYNGDVGLLLADPLHGGAVRAFFPGITGVRRVLPARLPAVETAFAMTVHKAQGSEFDEVCLVLPNEPSAVLTRELLYTGITRARRQLTVIGAAERIAAAIATRTRRTSGLFDALWRTAHD